MQKPYSEKLPGTAFLAFPGMSEMLLDELKERFAFLENPAAVYGDLFYFPDFQGGNLSPSELPFWAKCVMKNPAIAHFDSIGSCAMTLRSIQRNWAPYTFTLFRRAKLIQEKLPYINFKPRKFPVDIPKSPIGLWTLLDSDTAIFSAETNGFLPAGTLCFEEDHVNPPSRAYLKLQESLTLANLFNGTKLPSKDTLCFEAGASPGGWTWVLTQLGASVYAVDRAPLAPELMDNPLVKFAAHDAFTLSPKEVGLCDWVFSDVICYPERLYEWCCRWLDSGLTKNMICTIKMQGKTDWKIIKNFQDIPGSRIVHLNYNKHELTWIHTESQ